MVKIRGRGRRKSFRREFKSTIKYALIVAVGFIIAYAWREAVFNSAEKIVASFSPTLTFISSQLTASLLLTFLGLVLIYVITKLLRD